MTKKKIERLSINHSREINWLRWYFLRDKKNPKKTVLEQKIHEAFLKGNSEEAAFLTNLRNTTEEYTDKSDKLLLKTIREVYVYRNINVIGACQKILHKSPSPAYSQINDWFDDYVLATYKHIPLSK